MYYNYDNHVYSGSVCPCSDTYSCDHSSMTCKKPCNTADECGDDECCLSKYSGALKRDINLNEYAGFCQPNGQEGDGK